MSAASIVPTLNQYVSSNEYKSLRDQISRMMGTQEESRHFSEAELQAMSSLLTASMLTQNGDMPLNAVISLEFQENTRHLIAEVARKIFPQQKKSEPKASPIEEFLNNKEVAAILKKLSNTKSDRVRADEMDEINKFLSALTLKEEGIRLEEVIPLRDQPKTFAIISRVIEKINAPVEGKEDGVDLSPHVVLGSKNQFGDRDTLSSCSVAALLFALTENQVVTGAMIDNIINDLTKPCLKGFLALYPGDPPDALEVMMSVRDFVEKRQLHGYACKLSPEINLTFARQAFNVNIKKFIDSKNTRSVLFFTAGATLGLRKVGEFVEVFDSHGQTRDLVDLKLIKKEQDKNSVFVVRIPKSQYAKIGELIDKIYPIDLQALGVDSIEELGEGQAAVLFQATMIGYK